MKLFPLKTWRKRRNAIKESKSLLKQVKELLGQLDEVQFASKEFRNDAKSLRRSLKDVVAELEKSEASNVRGIFVELPQALFLKHSRHVRNAISEERALIDAILFAEGTVASGLDLAGSIPLDQARVLHGLLVAASAELRKLRKSATGRSLLLQQIQGIEKCDSQLRELKVLMVESSEAEEAAQQIDTLPLPISRENRRKRELLSNYKLLVVNARQEGVAYKLRESWRQFQVLSRDLKRESERSVARAAREIDMWLLHPELTPEFSGLFGPGLTALRLDSSDVDFLKRWAELKATIGSAVNEGFEAHWREITRKARKMNGQSISWQQLEAVALQVRARGMPPVYSEQ